MGVGVLLTVTADGREVPVGKTDVCGMLVGVGSITGVAVGGMGVGDAGTGVEITGVGVDTAPGVGDGFDGFHDS